MAAMTFANQQSKLSRLLGDSNTDNDSMWPLDDRKFELNRGEKQFSRDSKSLTAYETGTVSGQVISIPTDWVETFVLTVDDVVVSNDLEVSLTEFERYDNVGDKFVYFWRDAAGNREITFLSDSVNNLTYKLWYFKIPTTDLDSDSDESSHPDEYREASVYYAASELLEQVGKTQMSDRYRAKYQFFVDKASAESQKHYINKELPRPDVQAEGLMYDKDVQGIGTVSGW